MNDLALRSPSQKRRAAARRIGLTALAALACTVSVTRSAAPVPEPTAPPPATPIERRVGMMGTSLDIRVEAVDRATAIAASEAAVRALEAAEARLTTWRPSELGAFNAAAVGAEVQLSPPLARDLEAARRCSDQTGGAFDPGIGALVESWGLRTGGRVPSRAEQERAAAAGGNAAWRLDGARAARLHPGLRIEEGGFGKGAGLDDALAALTAASGVVAAELDLGGQWAGFGRPGKVTVSHPEHRQQAVLELALEPGSLSTSGNSERRIVVDGRPLGHLLDPRSGRPADDFGSISVWARSALQADCLSTGLYAMGAARALLWAREHPEVEVLVLRRDGRRLVAEATKGLRNRFRILDNDVEVNIH